LIYVEQRRARLVRRLYLVATLAVAALLVTATLTDAVQVGDSAEVTAAACNSGVAHPPGYPLYTMLGHAFCRLPLSTPAARVALFSACGGVLAVALLFLIVSRLTNRPWIAAASALLLATGDLHWRYSSLPEVIALHVALSLLVVYTAIRASEDQRARSAMWWRLACAFAFGLALSNHYTSIALAPFVVIAAYRPFRLRRLLIELPLCALVFGLGLLPYLYLLHADPAVLPHWGQTETVAGLIHHVARTDYGAFRVTIGGNLQPWSGSAAFLAALPRQLGWALLAVCLLGLLLCVARGLERTGHSVEAGGQNGPAEQGPKLALGRQLAARRDVAWVLALAPILTGPLLLMFSTVKASGLALHVIERYFILPVALLAIAVGVGISFIERFLLLHPRGKPRALIFRVAVFAVVGFAALTNYPRADVRQSYAAEDYAIGMLAVAEKGALIIGAGDTRLFATTYVQRVLGIRADVQYVDAKMLLYPWYVRQQRALFPEFDYEFQPGRVDSLRVLHRALRQKTRRVSDALL
jgi:hypothetical protein